MCWQAPHRWAMPQPQWTCSAVAAPGWRPKPASTPPPPQTCQVTATHLALVAAGPVGTLRPFPQGAVGGVAAGVVAFLGVVGGRKSLGQQSRSPTRWGQAHAHPAPPVLHALDPASRAPSQDITRPLHYQGRVNLSQKIHISTVLGDTTI